jgi:apolipoprotein D and lipocalin family protein
MGNSSSASSKLPALQPASNCNTAKFMGTWFVIGVKPTMFETTCSNAVERYTLLNDKSFDINIDFQFNKDEPIKSSLKSMPQKGWVQGDDKSDSARWKVSPLWPIKMPYLILEVDEQYSYTVIGYPSRDYCWIMSRKPIMPEATYDMLTKLLTEKHQYDLTGLRRVPQVWTAEEREKRGLTREEIPDSMLKATEKK